MTKIAAEKELKCMYINNLIGQNLANEGKDGRVFTSGFSVIIWWHALIWILNTLYVCIIYVCVRACLLHINRNYFARS